MHRNDADVVVVCLLDAIDALRSTRSPAELEEQQRVDDAVLALLHLVMHSGQFGDTRAWKGFPWEALNRLHARGLIDNPRSTARSVSVTPDGEAASRALYEKLFAAPSKTAA